MSRIQDEERARIKARDLAEHLEDVQAPKGIADRAYEVLIDINGWLKKEKLKLGVKP